MGGAVVDDPEHPLGRGVGLGGHHLVDESFERGDAGGVFAAAEHSAAVHVVGGQVGDGAASVVVVVDPDLACSARGRGGVAAAAGLDGGLFVGGDDVIACAQRFSLPG